MGSLIDAGVIVATLGGGAGVSGCMKSETEGEGSATGPLKIAHRLLMASNWVWQLSGVWSARTVVVRARRQ